MHSATSDRSPVWRLPAPRSSSIAPPGHLAILVAAITIAGLGSAPQANAVDRFWICTGASSYFDTPGCWSPGNPPGTTDNAVFSSGGARTVAWDNLVLTNWDNFWPVPLVTNANLSIFNTAVNFRSDAASYTSDAYRTYNITGNVAINGGSLSFTPNLATNPNLIMTVGGSVQVSNNGTLDTTGGAVVQSSGGLNLQSGGDAYTNWGAVDSAGVIFASNMMTVNGAQVGGVDSLWDVNTLIVGRNGSGNLSITAGGTVDAALNGFVGEFAGSSGTITVGGSGAAAATLQGGSLYLGGNNVGSGGAGSLVVNTGGLTNIAGELRLWNGSSSINTTGGGRVIAGTLTIQGGADVFSSVGTIGTDSGDAGQVRAASTATVTGAGSTWNMNSLRQLGGTGILNVTAGGALTATGSAFVGYHTGANQQLNINAASATLATAGTTYVGYAIGGAAQGAVNVTNGGTLTTGTAYLGYATTGTGLATVGGGAGTSTWNASAIRVGGFLSTNNATGTLTANSGGVVNVSGQMDVWGANGSVNTTGGGRVNADTLVIQSGADVDSTVGSVGTDNGYSGLVRAANTATVTGAGSTWNMDNLYLLGGTGILNVTAGGALTADSDAFIGYYTGANQQLNINAASATLATTYVGYAAQLAASQGAVNVTNGGTLTTGTAYLGGFSAGIGLATVGGGAGTSTWNASAIRVGGFGSTGNATGTLTVESGGVVDVSGQVDVVGANGSVDTTDGGRVNAGTLVIQSGGDVDSTYGIVGTDNGFSGQVRAASTATVTGAGSTWDMGNLFQLGGTGILNVTAGGALTASSFSYVGYNAGANQQLNINAASATLATADTTYVGYGSGGAAQGAVNVTNGGTLTTGIAHLGFNSGGTGLATIGGGAGTSTWNASALRVGGASSTSNATGALTVNGGGVVTVSGQTDVWGANGSINTTGGGVVRSSGGLSLQSGGDAYTYWGAVDSAGVIFADNMMTANGAQVGGIGSLWDMGTLIVGRNGAGNLGITAGGTVDAAFNGYVGEFAGSSGTITVGGSGAAGATLQVGAGGLYLGGNNVGSGGAGSLVANNFGLTHIGGELRLWNGSSSINTTGGGQVNANALVIQGGADVDSTVGATGSDYGQSGQVRAASTATVTGAGSTWDMNSLNQLGGTGILNVTAGGALTVANEARVGFFAGANQQLNIDAATVAVAGFMSVGYGNGGAAQGAVSVTNGGTLTTGVADLGGLSAGTGLATVGGGSGTSTWNTSALRVGGETSTSNATGTLTVESGGLVNVSNQLDVWGANGSVDLAGGTLMAATLSNLGTIQFTASSLLDGALDNQDQVNVAAGVTATFGGTVDNTGLVDLGAGSTAIFEALVSGDGDFTGTGTAVFEGGFNPGNSPGLVSFGGDVQLDAGNTLTMELGGTARGTGYDAIDVAGTITLAGILEIALYGGFDAPMFSTYDLIRAENLSDLFSSYLLPGGPQEWKVEYLADAEGSTDILRLTVVPVPSAVWLLGGALGALGWARRRQSAKRQCSNTATAGDWAVRIPCS